MRKYTIAMSVRMVCILLIFVVPGWWMWVFAIGAIVLPYIAVVLANVGDGRRGTVEQPGLAAPLSIERGDRRTDARADQETDGDRL